MSLMTEILDRLTGVAIVKERLDQTADRVERMADWLLDHEKRLTTLEVRAGTATPKRLPPKR